MKKLIFSDESRFTQTSDSRWIWARRGITNDSQFTEVKGYPHWIMIWGAIGYGYKSKLVIVDGMIDSQKYLDIIHESSLIRDANMQYGIRQYIFMQDGAPSHTSIQTTSYLNRLINLLENWPPNSCDLNPIEIIWGIIKQYVKQFAPPDVDSLKRYIIQAWNLIPLSVINRLVLSFRARCEAVMQEQGKSIMQRLRSHQLPHYNDNIYAILRADRRSWTPEEDSIINTDYQNHGAAYNLMATHLISRSIPEIQSRVRYLNQRRYAVNALLV